MVTVLKINIVMAMRIESPVNTPHAMIRSGFRYSLVGIRRSWGGPSPEMGGWEGSVYVV